MSAHVESPPRHACHSLNALDTAAALGFTLPSPAYIAGMILFSLVGIAAWRYGRLRGHPRTRWIGLALMLYPYVVANTLLMYAVGVALCTAAWLDLTGRWP